jgi:hypothetical protein
MDCFFGPKGHGTSISSTKVVEGEDLEPMVDHLLRGVWDPHIPGASVTMCVDAFGLGVFLCKAQAKSTDCLQSTSQKHLPHFSFSLLECFRSN